MLDAPSEVVGTVLIFLGKDANSENPEDLQAAEDVLMKIRPSIRYVNSSKYIDDLANGEICLALGWVGDVLQARDRADEAGKGNTIRTVSRRRVRSCSSTCSRSRRTPSIR
jgi:putrescine transport system substrate-binding protein